MENNIIYNSKKLFYELGYFRTKVSDITSRCGISTGRFYRHFESKEDLLVKIIKNELEVLSKNFFLLESNDEVFKIKMIVRAFLNFMTRDPFFFKMLIELQDQREKLTSSAKGWTSRHYTEIKEHIIEALNLHEEIDSSKRKLLSSMIESELKIYIGYLFTREGGGFSPKKLNFLDLDAEIENLSEMIINTCRSLNAFPSEEIIDPLTRAYTNKHFFKLVEKYRHNEKATILLFLDISAIFREKKHNFFSDAIIRDVSKLLANFFRNNDSIGRLCYSKFMILFSEDIHQDRVDLRMKKVVEDLERKYSFSFSKKIVWKYYCVGPNGSISHLLSHKVY